MSNVKGSIVLLTLICLVATALAMHLLGGIDPEQIQTWLQQAGIWAPIVYVSVYVVATLLILPSTALNLTGGAIFGPWIGTFWTSVAAIVAAIVAFGFTRTIGREFVENRMSGKWQAIDSEIQHSGLFYMFSIRLLPIIPYGLVNFAAGLTSVKFKDYLLGTALGTVPGVLPFVMLGSSGLKALRGGDILPLVTSLTLIGMLVAGATWYRHSRQDTRQSLQKTEDSSKRVDIDESK
jgi:uncharacterized membrane protein YdjX (TVP38/TMEM64 family)